MPNKTIEDFAYQIKDYMRSAEVVEGKNRIENLGTISYADVTTTLNSDKSISFNGTSTSDRDFRIVNYFDLTGYIGKDLCISGCTGGANDTYRLYFNIYDSSDTLLINPNSLDGGTVFTVPNNAQYAIVGIIVYSGQNMTGKTMYPMLCTASDWNVSHTYEPYYDTVSDKITDVYNVIDNKSDITAIATEESGATASKAYVVGEHFYKDGKFCTVISNISSGATLTKDTNYIEEDVGSALFSNAMMTNFLSAMSCVLLGNSAKTYCTINNAKYNMLFMIIVGSGGGINVFMGLLTRAFNDTLVKELLGGTDLVDSGRIVPENTGSLGFTLKFPSFIGGTQIWILSLSGRTLGGITTGTYT